MTIIRSSKIRLSIGVVKLIKTLSYRLFASLIGFFTIYISTGSVKIAMTITSAELIYKPVQYYLHEWMWIRIERKAITQDDNA